MSESFHVNFSWFQQEYHRADHPYVRRYVINMCTKWIASHVKFFNKNQEWRRINYVFPLKFSNVPISQFHAILSNLRMKIKEWYWTMMFMKDWLIDWLIIYGFTSRSRIFHLYGDVTIAGEGLQNLGLCSALRAFEQGGIFIVPHLLWHGTSVFPVSSEGPPLSVAFYDTHGDAEDLFQPGSSRG